EAETRTPLILYFRRSEAVFLLVDDTGIEPGSGPVLLVGDHVHAPRTIPARQPAEQVRDQQPRPGPGVQPRRLTDPVPGTRRSQRPARTEPDTGACRAVPFRPAPVRPERQGPERSMANAR